MYQKCSATIGMDLVGIRVHDKDVAALMRDVSGW